MAATAFGVPMSAISLLDADRLWFKSSYGLDFRATDRDASFCSQVVLQKHGEPLVVPDAAADSRFAQHELVTEKGVRFYAGAPISVGGVAVGTLCVLDTKPHATIDPALLAQLTDLAAIASSFFDFKDEARVRTRTAAELSKEEWRHALTLEAGKVGSWVWDLRSGEVVANDIFRRMYNIAPAKRVMIDEILAYVHPEDRSIIDAALEATFANGIDYVSEFRVKSGRWLIGRGRVYQRDAEGKAIILMGVNIDVTDAREAADHTRHLLRELNHRVKNTLAMIQSLARQTPREGQDPQHFIDSFAGRLRTLSEAHALLSDRDWSGIGLVELIHSQIDPYLVASAEQLLLVGEDVQLPPDQALGFGLIVHELASNALKFGAFSNPRGKVTLSWTIEGSDRRRLDMLWKESGGPFVNAPKEFGLGARLIRRSLDKILESEVALTFPSDGVEARINLPLS